MFEEGQKGKILTWTGGLYILGKQREKEQVLKNKYI